MCRYEIPPRPAPASSAFPRSWRTKTSTVRCCFPASAGRYGTSGSSDLQTSALCEESLFCWRMFFSLPTPPLSFCFFVCTSFKILCSHGRKTSLSDRNMKAMSLNLLNLWGDSCWPRGKFAFIMSSHTRSFGIWRYVGLKAAFNSQDLILYLLAELGFYVCISCALQLLKEILLLNRH